MNPQRSQIMSVAYGGANSRTQPSEHHMILRHLLAVLILPFTVVAIIPCGLLFSEAAQEPRRTDSPLEWFAYILGLLIFAAGFALFLWCVTLFARVGRGTLAPWDPTQSLVAAGPYRYVRNPMISGVITMLIGESLFFGSWSVAIWALFVFALNHASHPLRRTRPGRTLRLRLPHLQSQSPTLVPPPQGSLILFHRLKRKLKRLTAIGITTPAFTRSGPTTLIPCTLLAPQHTPQTPHLDTQAPRQPHIQSRLPKPFSLS